MEHIIRITANFFLQLFPVLFCSFLLMCRVLLFTSSLCAFPLLSWFWVSVFVNTIS